MVPFPPLRKLAALAIILVLPGLSACQKSDESSTTPPPVNTSAAPAAAAAPSPVTPNSFTDVTAQLDPGGDFYLYLSTAQWLSKLSHGVDVLHTYIVNNAHGQTPDQMAKTDKAFAAAKDMVQKSGLQEITGVGASSFNYAPGLYRNKVFLHHYADQGSGLIWSLYGKTPHPLTGIDMLPVDTSAAAFGDFDLAQFINFLRTEASQSGIPEFKQAVDQWQTQFAGISGLQLDDVLNSLNGSMGMVLTLDASNVVSIPVAQQVQTIPAPRLAILIAVKNDLVFKQVDKMLTGNPGVLKVEEPGLSMRTMPIPFILPSLNLRPSVAQWNGFLVIASDDTIIRNIVAAQKGGPGFKSTHEYAKLSAGLPDQGNSFAVITQQFADTVQNFRKQLYANQAGGVADAQAVQRILSRYEHTGQAMTVGALLPNGWLSVSQGSQGSSQLLAPMMIAPAAIMAGVVAPMMRIPAPYRPQPPVPPATSSGLGGMPPYPAPIPGTSP
jgi:hypothetical protein